MSGLFDSGLHYLSWGSNELGIGIILKWIPIQRIYADQPNGQDGIIKLSRSWNLAVPSTQPPFAEDTNSEVGLS